MRKFKVGDHVYGGDWCYGEIVDLEEHGALVEFETRGGGGTWYFLYEEMRLEEEE